MLQRVLASLRPVVAPLCVAAAALAVTSAHAAVSTFTLHDHPDGGVAPPTYGMRLDGLDGNASNEFTFSFDNAAIDSNPAYQQMKLIYDSTLNTVQITGHVYGGLDAGAAYGAPVGVWFVDMLYSVNVDATADGKYIKVTDEDAANSGSITAVALDTAGLGINDGDSFALTDEDGGKAFSFKFDNDNHRLGGASLDGDPNVFVGRGWLNHSDAPHIPSSDWLFTAEMDPIPEPSTVIIWAVLIGMGGVFWLRRRRAQLAPAYVR